jgi:hypothetical protein
VCEDVTLKKLIETSLPLFEHFRKHRKVVIPPLPRFLFKGCCSDYSHSVNISDESYTENLLDSVVHLRKNFKLELLARGVEKVSLNVSRIFFRSVPPWALKMMWLCCCVTSSHQTAFTSRGSAIPIWLKTSQPTLKLGSVIRLRRRFLLLFLLQVPEKRSSGEASAPRLDP